MYIYIYIHTCIYINTCICTYMYMCVYTYIQESKRQLVGGRAGGMDGGGSKKVVPVSSTIKHSNRKMIRNAISHVCLVASVRF